MTPPVVMLEAMPETRMVEVEAVVVDLTMKSSAHGNEP